jgi:peptidyl-prolyl cis-trans isomerase C
LADLEQKLKHPQGASATSPEKRTALLHELVRFEAAYVRAQEAGFDQQPEIARKIKAFIVDQYLQQQLKDNLEAAPVSGAEIEEYYRQHADHFTSEEKVRFAIIQFGFSPKADDERKLKILRMAESVRAEAAAYEGSERSFGALAQRYSQDQATRYIGGDAGWLSRTADSRWAPAVIEAAFALANPGHLSAVIQTSNACYLVKLIEKKEAEQRPLTEVAEAIRYQIVIEKRHRAQEAIYDKMISGLQIEINHALLKSFPAPPSPPKSVTFALPGS